MSSTFAELGAPGDLVEHLATRGILSAFDIQSQALVVTKYEPPHLIWYTAKIPLLGSLGGGFSFEREEQGTRLTRTTEGDLGGILGFISPMLLGLLRSSQQIELGNIKRLVEAASEPRVEAPRLVQLDKSLP